MELSDLILKVNVKNNVNADIYIDILYLFATVALWSG